MKTNIRKTLTFLVTIALVGGPLTAANADSAANKGQIQRLMVGADKSCQVGQLKVSDSASTEAKSNASDKSNGKSNGKSSDAKSNGKSASKSNGKSENSENSSDKSSLSVQAQKLIDQLTIKATVPSLTAANTLKAAKDSFTSNTAAAMSTYTGLVKKALDDCNALIVANKAIYDKKVTDTKSALTAALSSATTEEAKKAATSASKKAISDAATAFKGGAQSALSKYQSDLSGALGVQKVLLTPINLTLATAISNARLAL
jgi:hypothetical protein